MIGVVFQPRTLDLDLSVTQNLIYHAALHGIGKQQARARADDVLNRVGLSERTNDKVRNLSGGQMRQVEIARALLHKPRLLLLDEPTVGLDIKSRAGILGHVRGMVQEGVSVLWATHLIDEVMQEDHIVVLHQGRVLTHGTAAHIIEAADARDIRSAFIRLTQTMEAGHESS
jgi:ABC-2 type transport system ATP-binding protein